MSTPNQQPWLEKQDKPPKVEPWTAFGVAMIIAIGSALLATGTWIVRSNQTSRAVSKATLLREDLEKTSKQRDELDAKVAEQSTTIQRLEGEKSSIETESAKLGGELASVKRELDGVRQSLTEALHRDSNASNLPFGKLSLAFDKSRDATVVVHVDDDRNGISEGAVSSFVKQRIQRGGSQITIADQAPNTILVSIIAATTSSDVASVGVLIEVRQLWKFPGISNSFMVTVWRGHTIGVAQRDAELARFIDELCDDLVKGFEADLAK